MSLARAASNTFPANEEQVENLMAAQRSLSVLVADDNRTNQMVIAKILERVGHKATLVDDGEAAIQALKLNRFDVVLMDVNMPNMNGIEATKLYRFSSLGQARVPIVALTADATSEAWARCKEAGMDAFATKPIEPWQLLEVIDSVLSRSEVEQRGEQAVSSAIPIVRAKTEDSVNMETLADLERLGGRDFVAGLIAQFSNDTAELLSSLREAVADEDVQRFRDAAHALRGSAANLGALAIFKTCLALRAITPAQLAAEGDARVNHLVTEIDESLTMLKGHAFAAADDAESHGKTQAA
jgi:two-component system sensor histidine kinase RpfC